MSDEEQETADQQLIEAMTWEAFEAVLVGSLGDDKGRSLSAAMQRAWMERDQLRLDNTTLTNTIAQLREEIDAPNQVDAGDEEEEQSIENNPGNGGFDRGEETTTTGALPEGETEG